MSAVQNRFKQAHAPSGGSAAASGGKRGGPKNTAQNRFKQACIPTGGTPTHEVTSVRARTIPAGAAEPALPGRRRSAPSGGSALHEVKSVGAL